MKRRTIGSARLGRTHLLFLSLPLAAGCALSLAVPSHAAAGNEKNNQSCAGDNGGLALPPGFCATIFADEIGHARHLVVAPDGVVYVNTWSGRYYAFDKTPAGGFLVALQDTKGEGRADKIVRFGPSAADGASGGTGIGLYEDWLLAEAGDSVVRYRRPPGTLAPTEPPESVLSGLPLAGDHPMHPFAIDARGELYVDIASASNACQERNRVARSRSPPLRGVGDARRHLAV